MTPRVLGGALVLGDVTHVMGVINLSPESKNTHTIAESPEEARLMADRYRSWGATIVDVGGQSSHYENPTIADEVEIDRLAPVVGKLVADGHIVSVDTWKPTVAQATVAAGASIVNDTGGLADPAMRGVLAASGAAAVLVHIEAANPHAVDQVAIEGDKSRLVAAGFESRLAELEAEGIREVIIDPGIAINYRGDYQSYTRQQLEVIMGSSELRRLGKPLLMPIPRKRDIHRVVAYIALALEHKADIIRVHDVAIACDLARLFQRLPG